MRHSKARSTLVLSHSGWRLVAWAGGLALLVVGLSCSDDETSPGPADPVGGSAGHGAGGLGAGGLGAAGGAGGEAGGTPSSSPEAGLIPNLPLYDPPEDAIHIDPDNSDDPAEDGSLDHPFDSFEDISWSDGLVIALRRGTTLDSDVVEIRGSDLTIASYGQPGEARPLVHCTAVASQGNNRHAFYAANRSNLVLRDIEVHAPQATSCVRFGGDSGTNVEVINCKLHGAGWGLRSFSYSGLRVFNTEVFDIKDDGIFIQDMSDIEIEHCDVHDVNQNWVPPYTSQEDAGGDGIQLSNCNGWHVHHNVIDRTNSGNKFCFISNNPAQDDGVLEHNRMRGPLTDGDGGASIYFHDGTGLVVRYNIVEGPSPGPLYSHAEDLQIYGNVFFDMSGGLFVSGSASIDHNVFFGLPGAMSGGTIAAHNNIFDLAEPTDEAFGSISDLDESHNLFAQGEATAGSFVGDPAFVDPDQGDFHLQPGSDAIDSGIDVGVTEDMDGVAMPQGAAPDVGAYEYTADG